MSLAQTALADGIDRIHVFLNGKIIFMTEDSEFESDYTISVGDTLLFDAWTDWSLLENATLTMSKPYDKGKSTLTQVINNKSSAQFIYIVKEEDFNEEFNIILNYNIDGFEPRYFLSLAKGVIE